MPRLLCSSGTWIVLAACLGLGLRTYHYWREPAVWQDEAALIMNVLRLEPADMLGPLLHHEAAPPLFLLLERLVVEVLGDEIASLRLMPYLASCASVILLAFTARQLLDSVAAPVAVLLFSVSDRLLWHTAEAKPYCLDVLVATSVIAWLVVSTRRSLTLRCLVLAAFAPVAIWISYPACFVLGAVLLAFLPSLPGSSWRDRLGYGWLAIVVVLAFLALALGPAAAQRTGSMDSCWVRHFPSWSKPWSIPLWTVGSTFEVARYAFLPLGQILLMLAIPGAVMLSRTGKETQRNVIAMSLPLLLAYIASLMMRYPYGGSRLEVFMAPAICLLAAAGLPVVLRSLARRSRLLSVVLLGLALAPVGQTGYRLVCDWSRPASDEAASCVLDHMQPGDQLLANFWDYEYYFRDHEQRYTHWDGEWKSGLFHSNRVWVISNDHRLEKLPETLTTQGWKIVSRWDFHRAHVMLLQVNASGPDRNRLPSSPENVSLDWKGPGSDQPTKTPPR